MKMINKLKIKKIFKRLFSFSKNNFLQISLFIFLISFLLLNVFVHFPKTGANVDVYPFLIGDITIVTLYYGIFAPVFKTNNRETPEAYFTYLKNKIYSKKSFSLIFFMIIFHSIGTAISYYASTYFLMISNIAISSLVYLFFLSRIWSFFTKEAYSKKIFHQFKGWNKLVDKDILKDSISPKRKNKYFSLLNEIIAFIPSTKEQFSSLYPSDKTILKNYFLFYLSINSGYAFLYDRFKLFKKDEIKPRAFNINPIQITKEINQFEIAYYDKFLSLLKFIDAEDRDKLFSEMTIQKVNTNIRISTRTMGDLTKLCLNIEKSDWLWSMYFQFLAKYVSSFLTFLSLVGSEAKMKNAKNIAINTQYFSSDIYDWYKRLKNDEKFLGTAYPSSIYDRLLLQTPFELSKFIRLYDKIFTSLLNETNPDIITYENLNTIVKMLDNFIDQMNKIKNLENESKFDFGRNFKKILEGKMGEIFSEISVESIDLTEENEKQGTLLNFFIVNTINQDDKFAKKNLYILIQKIYGFISKYRIEEIKDGILYGRSNSFSNTEASSIYDNFLDLVRAGLSIYPISSKQFKGIVAIIQELVKISKRGGIHRFSRENNFTKMINQRFGLVKSESMFRQDEWFDLYNSERKQIEKEKKEFKSRNRKNNNL